MSRKVKHSDKLGVDYVFCRKPGESGRYITEDGVVFTEEEVSTNTDSEVKKLYALRKEGQPFDYEYAKTTGFIRKKKNLSFEDDEEEYTPSIGNKKKERSLPSTIQVLVMVTTAVAAIAALLSILYNGEYLTPRVGAFRAYSQASVMVVFATIAFEAGFLFLQKKGLWKALGVIFFALWLLPAAYSMFAIMNVNYDTYKKDVEVKAEVTQKVNAAVSGVSDYNESIKEAKEAAERAHKLYDAYVMRESYSIWQAKQLKKDADDADSLLRDLRSKKQAIIDATPEASKGEEVKRESFPEIIKRLFGINPDALTFWINILPAVFLDIVSPFGFAVVIFLEEDGNGKGKRREESAVQTDDC